MLCAPCGNAGRFAFLFYFFRQFPPGSCHFEQDFFVRFALSFRRQSVTLCSKLAILVRRSHLEGYGPIPVSFASLKAMK
jgi:hypothetical protein